MKDKRVDAYIEKQPSPQKEICSKLRKIIFDVFPGITEEMKWGVPSYAGGKYYIVALKKHVHMGFSIGALSDEQIALLKGSGKTMRVIEIESLEEIDKIKIEIFLRLVDED